MLIDKFDFMNYDTGVPFRNYVPFFEDKVLNRMRSYLAGNHEFTMEKNDLDFTLEEHEVPLNTLLSLSVIYLMHENNLCIFKTDKSIFIEIEQLFCKKI